MGIEDRLSQDEIDEADIVVFAIDTSVTDRDRFEGKKVLEIGTEDVIRDADSMIDQAFELAK